MYKKLALTIGNNYPGTSSQLSGCVNDAEDWALLLSGLGYNCMTMTEVTKDAFLAALSDLVAQTGWGDRLVLTYSGHGTWIPDSSGDESDGRDEAIVMTDYQHGGIVTDDELQRVFSTKRSGAGILVLSDSCFSGTVNKLFDPDFISREAAESRSESHIAQPRFLPPTEILEDLSIERAAYLETKEASTPRTTTSLISGSSDLEYSYDAWFGNRPNGAFTRNAIDCHVKGITLNSWFKKIRERLPSSQYPQSPQLTAQTTARKYLRAL